MARVASTRTTHIYPTSVFGKNTIGTSTSSIGLNRYFMSKVTVTGYITVDSLTFYGNSVSGTTGVDIIIFSDSGGLPLDRKAVRQSTVGTTLQWNTITFTTPVALSPGTYWFGLIFSNSVNTYYDATGGVSINQFVNSSYSNLGANPYDGGAGGTGTLNISMYLDYTPVKNRKRLTPYVDDTMQRAPLGTLSGTATYVQGDGYVTLINNQGGNSGKLEYSSPFLKTQSFFLNVDWYKSGSADGMIIYWGCTSGTAGGYSLVLDFYNNRINLRFNNADVSGFQTPLGKTNAAYDAMTVNVNYYGSSTLVRVYRAGGLVFSYLDSVRSLSGNLYGFSAYTGGQVSIQRIKNVLISPYQRTAVSGRVEANPPVAVFSPTDVTGLKLWLKADALSLNNNDLVASWTDSSGQNNHATEATVKPTYKTNQVNSLPAIYFPGSKRLTTPSIALSNMTLFLVMKPGATGNDYVITFTVGGTENGVIQGFVANTMEIYNNPRISMGSTSNSLFGLHTLTRDATNGTKTWKNTAVVTTNAAANTTSTGTIIVGTNFAADFVGYISELIIYDNELSTVNRQSVDSYLMTKYGL